MAQQPDRSPFRELGLPQNATTSEIKERYRKLAKQHHPDLNKSASSAEIFKRITSAYNQALDVSARRDEGPSGASAGSGAWGGGAASSSASWRPPGAASAGQTSRARARGPEDSRNFDHREWDRAHYGLHQEDVKASKQSQFVRNLYRRDGMSGAERRAAASEQAKRAKAPPKSGLNFLAPIGLVAAIWYINYQCNFGWLRRGDAHVLAAHGADARQRGRGTQKPK